MRRPVDPRLRTLARSRRSGATDAERRLWTRLRGGRFAGLKFRRQVPIGTAIADFVCFDRRLIVEVDGGQHAESDYDVRRDAELRRRGFRVLRFWNHDVLREIESVLDTIWAAVEDGGTKT